MSTITEAREQYDLGLRLTYDKHVQSYCGWISPKWCCCMVCISQWIIISKMAGAMLLFAFAPLGMILGIAFAGRNWSYSTLQLSITVL